MKMNACILPLFLLWVPSVITAQSVSGFTPQRAAEQLRLEQQFDQQLKAENISRYIRDLSVQPHHVGSPGGSAVVKYVADRFREWGFETSIATYYVPFPEPVTRVLEMTGSRKFTASLKETPYAEDISTAQKGMLPLYNCWSADGDVTAELVYVNYGVPADYEMLERMGVSVKGKIVIARYGQSWRGIKPKLAQEHGAIGCLIYNDPREDGYFRGEVYPKGAYKPATGAQRGSVMDMPVYPGDPSTPGFASVKDVKRDEWTNAPNLLKIPVQPISWTDAQPLLESLGGQVVPESWRGALPITYHVGPSVNKVHLKLTFDWQIRKIQNVIARLPGTEFPDEWIIRGNHHDAWVHGAADPVSGLAALMEEARAVGELVKKGQKNRRTLVYCAWDAEEPGLMGSTEWVEDHAAELQQKAVVYVNTDGNGRGYLFAGGSHALEPAFNEVAAGVTDPQTGVSVLQRRRSAQLVQAGSASARRDLLGQEVLRLDALGSGSDYSPFFQHLGIPSLNIGFGGEDNGGEYHTMYDTYEMYRRFKDPDFSYGVALAKVGGHTLLRFANADIMPFDFTHLQQTIRRYADEVTFFTNDLRENTEIENQLIRDRHYVLANNVTAPLLPPAMAAEVPYLNFAPLQNELEALEASTRQLQSLISTKAIPEAKWPALNQRLYRAEQQLLLTNGLPRRSWYKHSIYAPGFYTGYGVKTLPGIREAIEQRDWKETQEQIEAVAAAVKRLRIFIDQTVE